MGTRREVDVEAPGERSRPRPVLGQDAMLLLLTWAAGSMDAISYLGLGHVFTAMMTGNTVLLALALGQGQVRAALRAIIALGGFVLGVALGAAVAERGPRRGDWPPTVTHALGLEALLLALFTLTWHLAGPARGAGVVHALIVVSGLAMGVQAAAVRCLGVPGIATTYISGTLTSLVASVVDWLRSAAPPAPSGAMGQAGGPAPPPVAWERRVRLLVGVFLIYGLGALAGAILQARSSSLVTFLPLVAVGVVVLGAGVGHWRR